MLVMLEKRQGTLRERCIEHAWSNKDSAVRAHINECDGIKHIKNLMFLNISVDVDDININVVKNNVRIIDSHRNWNVLLYKEAIRIKELKPLLNIGLKALKELGLF